MFKAKSEHIKNAVFPVVPFNYQKPGNNSNLVLLIILQIPNTKMGMPSGGTLFRVRDLKIEQPGIP